MAFDFPGPPLTVGQTFEPQPGTLYRWNGYGWDQYEQAGIPPVDAYSKTESDDRYVNIDGDNMTGMLAAPVVSLNNPDPALAFFAADMALATSGSGTDRTVALEDKGDGSGDWLVKLGRTASDGGIVQLKQASATGWGGPSVYLDTYKPGGSSANDALGHVVFRGQDASGAIVSYAGLYGVITDTTTGSPDGRLVLATTVNGATLTGIQITGPTVLLAQNPVNPMEAATKNYVDTTIGPNTIPEAPIDGKSYARKNAQWAAISGAIIADTPPPAPQPGTLWFESDSGHTFIWYADIDSAQWVQIDIPGAPGQGVPAGGSAGQVLTKLDATNYTTYWSTPAGGGGGGIPDAPADGQNYGRQNAAWNAVLGKNNDIVDGGNF